MTHLWINYRGMCLLVILVGLQTIYAVSKANPSLGSFGRWGKSDGSSVSMPCPEESLYADRSLKMPEGCRVKRAGVWTSVKRHATQKAELERLLREIRSTQATLREYRENVKSEREALASYFQSTSSELKSIAETIKSPTFSWQSAAMGFATGAAVCGGVVIGGAF